MLLAQRPNVIKSTTDKLQYEVGEEIVITLKAKKAFQLATDGDCSSSELPPMVITFEDGEWSEIEGLIQMCCGLPYSLWMGRSKKFSKEISKPGIYKIVIFTDSGQIKSNQFTVISSKE